MIALMLLSLMAMSCRKERDNSPKKGDRSKTASATSAVDGDDAGQAGIKAQEALEEKLISLGFRKDVSDRIKVIMDDADDDLTGSESERLVTLLKRILVDYASITDGLTQSQSDDLLAGIIATMSLATIDDDDVNVETLLSSIFSQLLLAVIDRAEAQPTQRSSLLRAIPRIVELGTSEVMKDDAPRATVLSFLSQMFDETLRGLASNITISDEVKNLALRKLGASIADVAVDTEYVTVWEGMHSFLTYELESVDTRVYYMTHLYWGMQRGIHFTRGTTAQERLDCGVALESLMTSHLDAMKSAGLLTAENETAIRAAVNEFDEDIGLINLAPKVCEDIDVGYRGFPVVNSAQGNWIAIAEASSADAKHLYRYKYLPSGTSGRITFETKGLEPDTTYELRAYLDWGGTGSEVVVARQTFTLSSNSSCDKVDVTVSDDTLKLGQPMEFAFTGLSYEAGNWASVARTDQANHIYLKYSLLTTAASGTASVATTGLAAGNYELRIYERWNTTHEYFIYKRVPFTVAVDGCPYNYLWVPSNATLGTSAFCVMKYEAKNVASTATPEAAGLPWATIARGANSSTASSAWKACADLGTNFDLISNAQWQAIGRSIEATISNWSNGSNSGQNFINYGHSDGSAGRLAASTDDDPCAGTGQTNCSNNAHADWSQKRTHSLATGDVVWDIAGNVMEWVKDDNAQSWGTTAYVNQMFTPNYDLSKWGASTNYLDKSSSPRGGLGYGIVGASAGGVLRGGNYADDFSAGIYASELSCAATHSSILIGFRCIYQP